MAQRPFTECLQQPVSGQGNVILHQNSRITELVNGNVTAARIPGTSGTSTSDTIVSNIDSLQLPDGVIAQKIRVNGFRIQVFSGGNSRQAKQLAQSIGNRVKNYFSELPVYIHFQSPHWICRIGDFKTYEEANEVFLQLKETRQFEEAVIVKSKVNAYVY